MHANNLSYTLTIDSGCHLVTGSVAVSDFVALTDAAGAGAVMSPHLARIANVTFAWGAPTAIAALIAKLLSNSKTRAEPLEEWLRSGEHGESSLAMVKHLTSHPLPVDRIAHPHDAADLGRCRMLLEAVPTLVSELPRMAKVSPQWAQLVGDWNGLCALMDNEAPNWRDSGGACKATSARMRELILSAGSK